MFAPPSEHQDCRRRRQPLTLAALLLGTLLTASQAPAQTQPNSNLPQSQRPATTPVRPGTVQPNRPGTPAQPASRWHLPFFGNRQNTPQNAGATNNNVQAQQQRMQAQQHFWGNLFHRNGNTQSQQQGEHSLGGSLQRALGGGTSHAAGATSAGGSHPMHLASRDLGPSASRGAQSQALVGSPALPGSRIAQSPSGSLVRTAADGSIIDVRNAKNGTVIQHGLDGSRRVTVEQPDGSRVFAAGRGVGYVQHPYLFHAQPFDHRTRYLQGHLSHQFYRPYEYGGKTLDVYAPQRFYSPDFYRSVSAPYTTPLVPQWNYVATPTPWYTTYKSYFTPETSYSSPTLWLTDFVLATSLIEAYQAHLKTPPPATATATTTAPPTAPAPTAATTPEVTPEVKEMVADEVSRQVKEESVEARENAQSRDLQPGSGGVVKELQEKEPHVFVADADLDLVDPSGRRCMLSEGDVVQVVSAVHAKSGTAQAVVLASKGPGECERAAQVDIAVSDLQEMQNHMRETIDQGLASSRAGGQAETVTPAFAAAAPPPDQNAAQEIQRQQEIAAAADG